MKTAILTVREAAARLNISEATLRNWRKMGHIRAHGGKQLGFSEAAVRELAEKIHSNKFSRLRARANKSASGKTPAPSFADPERAAAARAVAEAARASRKPAASVLFLSAVRLLVAAGECALQLHAAPDRLVRGGAWKRKTVGRIIERWFGDLSPPLDMEAWNITSPLADVSAGDDFLGHLYQSLTQDGERSGKGAYFTPDIMVDESLDGLGGKPGTLLDPCCGTGRFLLGAARRFGLAMNCLFGIDRDPVAVGISSLNLLLAFPLLDEMPRVACLDALEAEPGALDDAPAGGFDAVASNPPWGGTGKRRRAAERQGETPRITSGETFSLFIEKSLSLVRRGGRLSFILPESVLATRVHADVRRLMLAEARILRIARLEHRFAGVFTPAVRVDLEKGKPPPGWGVEVIGSSGAFTAAQRRFSANADRAFDIEVSARDEELLARIDAAGRLSLKDSAEWALGVVTGDNRRLVLNAPAGGAEPILRGRDLFPYIHAAPRGYVVFDPAAFQQTAKERLYRSPEKLVYRFVSHRLVFSHDARGLVTLNSANIVVPKVPGLSMRLVLALLNSSVLRYYHAKRCGGRKILRKDLESLPLPGPARGWVSVTEGLVGERLAGDAAVEEVIDNLVGAAYGLDAADMERIRDILVHWL